MTPSVAMVKELLWTLALIIIIIIVRSAVTHVWGDTSRGLSHYHNTKITVVRAVCVCVCVCVCVRAGGHRKRADPGAKSSVSAKLKSDTTSLSSLTRPATALAPD